MMRTPVLLMFLLAPTALQAQLQQQRLAAEPASQEVGSGEVATVTIVYDSDDRTMAGVAARLHYDSSKLVLESRELLFPAGITGHQDQPDSGDAYVARYDDGDPATDRRYLAAWADVAGAWPGNDAPLPLPLIRLRFRVQDFFPSTDLILTGSTCSACRLEVQSATVVVGGRGPIDSAEPAATATAAPTLAATAAATPTTTPTPSELEEEPWLDQAPEPGRTVEGIPTLSEVGTLLLMAALAGSAVAILLRNRR
jgi:hypothetical protein